MCPVYLRIFWLAVIDRMTIDEIVIELKQDGVLHTATSSKYPAQQIKKKIQQMREINPDDLMDIFEEILQLKNSNFQVFTREYILNQWSIPIDLKIPATP